MQKRIVLNLVIAPGTSLDDLPGEITVDGYLTGGLLQILYAAVRGGKKGAQQEKRRGVST